MGYLDVIPAAVFVVDEDVRIINFNHASAMAFGLSTETAILKRGGEIMHCIHAYETSQGCGYAKACPDCVIRNSVYAALQSNMVYRKHQQMVLVNDNKATEMDCLVTVAPISYLGEKRALLVVEDVTEVFELRRLIPVCAWCKKVRDDSNYWINVEHYLSQRTISNITYGLCPECEESIRKEAEGMKGG